MVKEIREDLCKFHKKNLIKDGISVFKNKPAEDMFDHLMIDKILTKEVEKLVPDDEVVSIVIWWC